MNFFVDFAKENSFDPLVAANWYKISKSDIAKQKVFVLFLFLFNLFNIFLYFFTLFFLLFKILFCVVVG